MQQQAAPGGSTETASKEAASRQQGHIIDYGLRFLIPASREKPGLSDSLGVLPYRCCCELDTQVGIAYVWAIESLALFSPFL